MGQSWSGLRKELEQKFLCDSLRGRVQYFLTHYHGAPDKCGRIAVRVDGKEVLHGNPYSFEFKYRKLEDEIKSTFDIPKRQWSGRLLYDEENKVIESAVLKIAINDGVFEIYNFTDAVRIYKNQSIEQSLSSRNPLVRMFAVLDRRVGKRKLRKLASQVYKQPTWLQFFYKLRMDAENL